MLRKWTLGNFKAVADEVTLDLAPVTVLCGANSSGKSTLLQSILLIAQTLRAKPGEQPLILNGEYVRLGYISDIVHDSQPNQPFVFGFELDGYGDDALSPATQGEDLFPISLAAKVCSENGSSEQPRTTIDTLDLHWGKLGKLSVRTLQNRYQDLSHPRYAAVSIPPDIRAELQQGLYSYEVTDSSRTFKHVPSFAVQLSLHHFLPYRFLQTYNALTDQMEHALEVIVSVLRTKQLPSEGYDQIAAAVPHAMLERKLKDHVKTTLYDVPKSKEQTPSEIQSFNRSAGMLGRSSLKEWLDFMSVEVPPIHRRRIADLLDTSIRTLRSGTEDLRFQEVGVRANVVPPDLRVVLSMLTDFYTNRVYYVGPLRESPQFIYNLPPYPELTHVGLKGEFTAPVLEHFKGTQVEYPLPPELVRKSHRVDKAPLTYALRVWLEAMGLLEGVTTTDRGKMGTELAVQSAGVSRSLDLTSVGVGVSQVLPTLVMGLIAPPGTTFLLEQPELHLHPKVQAVLADFLLGLTSVGKQCIVETHSEYLVNRLRRRVAEDESNTLSGDISLYFVEREEGRAKFRKVDVNDYGAILEWPKGFFDEGPSEAQRIMDAAMRKRRRAQSEGQGTR